MGCSADDSKPTGSRSAPPAPTDGQDFVDTRLCGFDGDRLRVLVSKAGDPYGVVVEKQNSFFNGHSVL